MPQPQQQQQQQPQTALEQVDAGANEAHGMDMDMEPPMEDLAWMLPQGRPVGDNEEPTPPRVRNAAGAPGTAALQQLLRSQARPHVLACLRHGEVQYVLELPRPGAYHTSHKAFMFVAFRLLHMRNPAGGMQPVLVSWCHGCPCTNKTGLHGMIPEAVDLTSSTPEEFFGPDQPLLCEVATHWLAGPLAASPAQFVTQQLQPLTQTAQQAQVPSVAPVPHTGGKYTAANADESLSLQKWGIVKALTAGTFICMSCPAYRRDCPHHQAVANGNRGRAYQAGGAQQPQQPLQQQRPKRAVLTEQGFERQLQQALDSSTGRFKLTCISQQRLPEEVEDDAQLLQQYNAQSVGSSSLPAQLDPQQPMDTPCPHCGQADWSSVEYGQQCKVFLPHALVHVQFGERRCQTTAGGQACPGRLTVDGKEYLLLRKSKGIAYSLALLYQWQRHCGVRGIGWYTYWRDTLMTYKNVGDDEDSRFRKLRKLLRNYQRCAHACCTAHGVLKHACINACGTRLCTASVAHRAHMLCWNCQLNRLLPCPCAPRSFAPLAVCRSFCLATLDFIVLQDVDYRYSFMCCHNGMLQQFDGITIAFKRERCFLVRPWAADLDAQLTHGSLFKDRVFVQSPAVRTSLHRFSGLKLAEREQVGLTSEEHAALLQELERQPAGSPERSLLPLLRSTRASPAGGRLLAAQRFAELVFNLSTPASAAHVLSREVWPVVDRLVDGAHVAPCIMKVRQGHASVQYEELTNAAAFSVRTLTLGALWAQAAV